MNIEIERKFLVCGEYKSKAYSHSHIEQGYFDSAPGRTIRVRIRDDKAYLTIKGPSNKAGLARYEFETEVSLEDGRQLMALCRPGRIDKTRWLIKNGYEKPDFLGKEVTGDRRYYNSHLMRFPYCLWGHIENND